MKKTPMPNWGKEVGSGACRRTYDRFRPRFARLAMMEMIRLSSIARADRRQGDGRTPFGLVNQVNRVDVRSFDLMEQKLKIEVEFDLKGIGSWRHALMVFISTPEQLAASRANAQFHSGEIRNIASQSARY